MLTLADLKQAMPQGLSRRLTDASLHQDRCRRGAASFDLSEGFEAIEQAADAMDEHAASIAAGARFVALVEQFIADHSSGRPAPVLQLAAHRKPEPARPAAAPVAGLRGWLRSAFGGSHAAEVA